MLIELENELVLTTHITRIKIHPPGTLRLGRSGEVKAGLNEMLLADVFFNDQGYPHRYWAKDAEKLLHEIKSNRSEFVRRY